MRIFGVIYRDYQVSFIQYDEADYEFMEATHSHGLRTTYPLRQGTINKYRDRLEALAECIIDKRPLEEILARRQFDTELEELLNDPD